MSAGLELLAPHGSVLWAVVAALAAPALYFMSLELVEG